MKNETNQILIEIRKLISDSKPLRFDEACGFLGVSASTLYKMTHLKKIPFSKPGGKVLYFKKSDLISWMNSNLIDSKVKE